MWNKFGLIFLVLLLAMITGFILLLQVPMYSATDAAYLTIMDMTGSALTRASLGGPEKVSQVILTGDGMALLPLVTAIIVGARLTGSIRGEPRPRGGHVIVVGLGDVGTRVIGELHDLGFDVGVRRPGSRRQGHRVRAPPRPAGGHRRGAPGARRSARWAWRPASRSCR